MRCTWKSGLGAWVGGFFVAAFGLGVQSRADAIRPTITYSTTGGITDTSGIDGTPVIRFEGVDHGTFTTPEAYQPGQNMNPIPFWLVTDAHVGNLVFALPPAGTATDYHNVPFEITFKVDAVNGDASAAPAGQILIKGFLNGQVRSDGVLDLNERFANSGPSSAQAPPFLQGQFQAAGLLFSLAEPHEGDLIRMPPVPGSDDLLVRVVAAPVPEPAQVAYFSALGAGLVGLSTRRRALAKRPNGK